MKRESIRPGVLQTFPKNKPLPIPKKQLPILVLSIVAYILWDVANLSSWHIHLSIPEECKGRLTRLGTFISLLSGFLIGYIVFWDADADAISTDAEKAIKSAEENRKYLDDQVAVMQASNAEQKRRAEIQIEEWNEEKKRVAQYKTNKLWMSKASLTLLVIGAVLLWCGSLPSS